MERQLVEIFITHVEKEGPLLKLWAQTDRATPTYVERTINQLTEKFDLGLGVPDPSELAVGQLCCAKYNDGIYYRARITSLADLAKGEIGVQFADYGNLEIITLNNLRSLEQTSTSLSTIADQASDFYLAGVVPLTGEWSAQSLKFVKDVICYVELKCIFVGQTAPTVKYFIKLIYQNADFSSVLIERRIGVTILVDTQVTLLQSIMNKKCRPMHSTQMWPSYNPEVPPPLSQPVSQLMARPNSADKTHLGMAGLGLHSGANVPTQPHLAHMPMGAPPGASVGAHVPPGRGIQRFNSYPSVGGHVQVANAGRMTVESPPPKREPALNFESICLELGSQYDVRVAYVEDGPYCFVVSLKHMENVLGKMLTEINSVPPSPMTRPPMIGTTCLGRYSLDGSLCRAVVVTVVSDSCKVYYVDFGHSETVPYSELFELPQHYVTYPKVMAIQVSHAGLTELSVGQEMKDLFKEYVVGKYFTLLVVPSESHRLKQYGILYEGGRGVLDIIQDQIEARKIQVYPVIPALLVGSTKPILVSFVESLDCFFVQLEDHTEILETVMSEILTHCEGTALKLRITDLHEGLVCCAKFVEDEQWYRAQISHITKEGIFVNYVDYGNTERVQLESLRLITPELIRKLQAQAIRCCLTKVHNWPKDEALIDKFTELTVDKTLIMQVIEHRPDGCPVVELHDLSLANSAPVAVSVELQKMMAKSSGAVSKQPNGAERNVYKAPAGTSNDSRESKPYVDHRSGDQNNHAGSGDNKYQRSGSRNEPMTDWRAKDDGRDERGGRQRGDGDKNWGGKNNTWEGSNESKTSRTGFPQTKVPIGDTNPAQLVFVENPEDFYVQLTPDAALNDMMAEIAAKYEGGAGRALHKPAVGAACIAQFSEDESWYRAVVLSVDDRHAKVQFVDYGNVDDVPLGSVKEITPDFLNFPAQGVRCSLASALPKGSDWTDDEINDFTAIADGKPLEVKFVSEKNGLYSVVLKDVKTGKVINEMFGAPSRAAAKREPVQSPPSKPVERAAPPSRDRAPPPSRDRAPPPSRDHAPPPSRDRAPPPSRDRAPPPSRDHAPPPSRDRAPPPAPQKPVIVQLFADPAARFVAEAFDPEAAVDVCVCWFNSPKQFFVQVLSKAAQVERTMGDIQAAYKGVGPNVKATQPGTPVIARYLGDNSLCRAEIVSSKDANAHIVQYVDFGNCDLVGKNNMWQIEARFVEMPKQAILCSLTGIKAPEGEWPKDAPALDKLFQDERYSCTFHGPLEGKQHVTLTHAGASVAEELVASGLAAPLLEEEAVVPCVEVPCVEEPAERKMLEGQTLRAAVTYVEGVAKFFVHLDGNRADEIQAMVDAHAAIPENILPFPAEDLAVNKRCMATSDGSQWYRARIVDCSGTLGVYVVFVDYGDGDEVTADKMIPIPAELSAYPDQAVECGLTGCDAAAVKPEVEDQFKADNEGSTVILHVDSLTDARLNVTVYGLDGKRSELVKDVGDGRPTVAPVCPQPMLVQKPRVVVSHVDDASSVWLQKTAEMDALTDLLGRMYAHYEDEGKGVEVEATEGLVCSAKSANDEQWYRARVVSVDGGVNVLYVDYGNSELLEASSIKALDASFYTPHAAAVQVTLPVVSNPDKEIDLAALTAEVEYVAAFSRDEGGGWLCELFNNKETLSEQLVESGWERMERYPFDAVVEELTKSPKLGAGTWASVFVSHADSPREFWVQRAENSAEIEKLQEDLQAAVESLAVATEPEVGQMCAALFSEDGSWYRATVLEVNDATVTVRFVDYGNTDVVDVTTSPLRALDRKLSKPEVYAVKCGLDVSPVGGEFSAEAVERFSALALDSELPFNAAVIAAGDTVVLDLFRDEKSFFATLIEEGLVVQHFPENSAFVSHVNSPSEFWIQYQRVTSGLETMAESMGLAGEFEPLTCDEEGTVCAAQFVDDEQWYRARVAGATDEGTRVFFVDYGNSAVATELRALPDALAAEPHLAKRCTLDSAGEATEWSEQASEKFAEMAENATVFDVEVIVEGDPAQVALSVDNKNVAELLLSLAAKPEAVESGDAATEIVVEAVDEDQTSETVSKDDDPIEESIVLESEADKPPLVQDPAELTDETGSNEIEDAVVAKDSTLMSSVSADVKTESNDNATTCDVIEPATEESSLSVSSEPVASVQDGSEEVAKESDEETIVGESKESDELATCDYENESVIKGDTIEVVETAAELEGGEKEPAAIATGEDESEGPAEERFDEPMEVDETIADELDVSKLPNPVEQSETSEDLDSSGNSQFLDATSDVEKSVASPSETLNAYGQVGLPGTPPCRAPVDPTPVFTPREDKIVPGSISRGLSEEELQQCQFSPIVDQLQHPEELPVEETKSRSYPATPVREVLHRVNSLEQEYVPSPVRLRHHERIVPGSISSGSSVDELRDPIENGIEIAEDTIADISDAVRDSAETNLSSIDSAKELKDLSDIENGNDIPEDVGSTDAAALKGVDGTTNEPVAKE